jgi:hypothetical protein
MEKNCYVYIHYRNDNNKPFYVGKGSWNENKKYKRYKYSYGRNPHWKNIVNKVGYTIRIIENFLTEDEAFDRESYYINLIGFEKLCNMTRGGEGIIGHKHTEETKKKCALFGVKNGMFNKTHSDNVKKILSEKRKGVNAFKDIEHPKAKKVINIETGEIYNSIREASKNENINNNTLKKYLSGSIKNKTKIRYL